MLLKWNTNSIKGGKKDLLYQRPDKSLEFLDTVTNYIKLKEFMEIKLILYI